MKDIDTILKAINLASYENVKSLEVQTEDLEILRAEIKALRSANKLLETRMVKFEKALTKGLVTIGPAKLDTYC
jgi:4-alpha-glucanotransferase